jgi:GNAT superfamily N-acetyltransferase
VEFSIVPADAGDAAGLSTLHVESWRNAYRGLLPDAFLDGPVVEDLMTLWRDRMSQSAAERQLVIKAVSQGSLIGLACVLTDADSQWGPRLDNLHVKPGRKGHGVGWQLFRACCQWVVRQTPDQHMHLWVIENNYPARQFYDRQGGVIRGTRTLEIARGIHVPELRYVWELSRDRQPF